MSHDQVEEHKSRNSGTSMQDTFLFAFIALLFLINPCSSHCPSSLHQSIGIFKIFLCATAYCNDNDNCTGRCQPLPGGSQCVCTSDISTAPHGRPCRPGKRCCETHTACSLGVSSDSRACLQMFYIVHFLRFYNFML